MALYSGSIMKFLVTLDNPAIDPAEFEGADEDDVRAQAQKGIDDFAIKLGASEAEKPVIISIEPIEEI